MKIENITIICGYSTDFYMKRNIVTIYLCVCVCVCVCVCDVCVCVCVCVCVFIIDVTKLYILNFSFHVSLRVCLPVKMVYFQKQWNSPNIIIH